MQPIKRAPVVTHNQLHRRYNNVQIFFQRSKSLNVIYDICKL